MIENLPIYVSIIFILTTFLTIGIFLSSTRKNLLFQTTPAKILTASIILWMLFTATLAFSGFYQNRNSIPPRIFLFGVVPTLIFILLFFIFFRKNFIEKLSLKNLTILHIIRIPIELVLFWLAQNGLVSTLMTFEGWNYDILSGITAPIIYFAAFRNDQINRGLLIIWNFIAFGLLLTIVTIAFLAFPSPMQQISFSQPNLAVMYFPFIWLPAIVVPIVFFSHLISLWKLFK